MVVKRLFVVLLALAICSTAGADFYVNIGISSGGGWPYSPYVITPDFSTGAPGWMQPEFETFCVERYRSFSDSPGNYLATIDDSILYGDDGGPVALDHRAKKIYAAYLNGAFEGVAGITGNVVQTSVWGAQSYGSYTIHDGIGGIINGADASAIAGWNNVKALNLWSNAAYDGDRQSQMVMTPVPGAGILGAIGLAFASWRLRRRKVTEDS